MPIKEITPQQAHETLSADKTVVYIDVRTAQEFANGHPSGAVNIPVAFADPARGMVLNPDFVTVVEKNFAKDKKTCHFLNLNECGHLCTKFYGPRLSKTSTQSSKPISNYFIHFILYLFEIN